MLGTICITFTEKIYPKKRKFDQTISKLEPVRCAHTRTARERERDTPERAPWHSTSSGDGGPAASPSGHHRASPRAGGSRLHYHHSSCRALVLPVCRALHFERYLRSSQIELLRARARISVARHPRLGPGSAACRPRVSGHSLREVRLRWHCQGKRSLQLSGLESFPAVPYL
jgi:hypothetical protein